MQQKKVSTRSNRSKSATRSPTRRAIRKLQPRQLLNTTQSARYLSTTSLPQQPTQQKQQQQPHPSPIQPENDPYDIDFDALKSKMKNEKIHQIHRLLRMERYLSQNPFSTELRRFLDTTTEATNDKTGRDAFLTLYSTFLHQYHHDVVSNTKAAGELKSNGGNILFAKANDFLTNTFGIKSIQINKNSSQNNTQGAHNGISQPRYLFGALKNDTGGNNIEGIDENELVKTITFLQDQIQSSLPEASFLQSRLIEESKQLRKHYTHQYIHLHQAQPKPSKPHPDPVMPKLTDVNAIFLEPLEEHELREFVRAVPQKTLDHIETLELSLKLHLKRDINTILNQKTGKQERIEVFSPTDLITNILPITPYKHTFPAFLKANLTAIIAPNGHNSVIMMGRGVMKKGEVSGLVGHLVPQYKQRINTLSTWIELYKTHLNHCRNAINHPTVVHTVVVDGGFDQQGHNNQEKDVDQQQSTHNTIDSIEPLHDYIYYNDILPPFLTQLKLLERDQHRQVISTHQKTIFLQSHANIDPLASIDRWMSRSADYQMINDLENHIINLENEKGNLQSIVNSAQLSLRCINSLMYQNLFGEFNFQLNQRNNLSFSSQQQQQQQQSSTNRSNQSYPDLIPLSTPVGLNDDVVTKIHNRVAEYRAWLTLLDKSLSLFDPTLVDDLSLVTGGNDLFTTNNAKFHLPVVAPRKPKDIKGNATPVPISPTSTPPTTTTPSTTTITISPIITLMDKSSEYRLAKWSYDEVGEILDRKTSFTTNKTTKTSKNNKGNGPKKRSLIPHLFINTVNFLKGTGPLLTSPEKQLEESRYAQEEKREEERVLKEHQAQSQLSVEERALQKQKEQQKIGEEAKEREYPKRNHQSNDLANFGSQQREELFNHYEAEKTTLMVLNQYKTLLDVAMFNVVIRHRLFVQLYGPFVKITSDHLDNGSKIMSNFNNNLNKTPVRGKVEGIGSGHLDVSNTDANKNEHHHGNRVEPSSDNPYHNLKKPVDVSVLIPSISPFSNKKESNDGDVNNTKKIETVSVTTPELIDADFFKFPTQYHTLSTTTLPILPQPSLTITPTFSLDQQFNQLTQSLASPSRSSSSFHNTKMMNTQQHNYQGGGNDGNDGRDNKWTYHDPLKNLVTFCLGLDWHNDIIPKMINSLGYGVNHQSNIRDVIEKKLLLSGMGITNGNTNSTGENEEDVEQLVSRFEALHVPTVDQVIQQIDQQGDVVEVMVSKFKATNIFPDDDDDDSSNHEKP